MTTTQNHCPLAYCDPHECGWRAGDTSCEWNDQAITMTRTDTGDEDDA